MKTFRRLMGLILVITCGVLVATAKVPPWWISRGVINTNLPPNNYSPVNLGQLKHVAKQAYWEMEAKLPNGAGDTLGDLVFGFAQKTNANYLPINLGQLKYVAKPFYDRLIQEGYIQSYPWTQTKADDNNYAAANLGQLKYLFSFDLDEIVPNPEPPPFEDSDEDGLSDALEVLFWGGLDEQAGSGDADGDGVSNQQEQENGTNPNDPNDGGENSEKPKVSCATITLDFDYGLIGKVYLDNKNRVFVSAYSQDLETASLWVFQEGQWQQLLGNEYRVRDINENGEVLLKYTPEDPYKEEHKSFIFDPDTEKITQIGDISDPGLAAEASKNYSGVIGCQYIGSVGVGALDMNNNGNVVGFVTPEYRVSTKNYSEPDKKWYYNTYTNSLVSVVAYWPNASSGYVLKNQYWINQGSSSIVDVNDQSQVSINHLSDGMYFWSQPNNNYSIDYFATEGLRDINLTEHGLLHTVRAGNYYFHQMASNPEETYIGIGPMKEINYQGQVAIGDNFLDNNGAIWKYDEEKERYFPYEVQEVTDDSVKDSFQDLVIDDVNSNGLIVARATTQSQQQEEEALAFFPSLELTANDNEDNNPLTFPYRQQTREKNLQLSSNLIKPLPPWQSPLWNQTLATPNPNPQYSMSQQKVVLFPFINITNLWSDQLPEVHANWIQKAKTANEMYMTGQDSKPYILMGSRADGKAYVKAALKDKLPENFEDSLLFRLSVKGQNDSKPGTSTYDSDKQEVSITAEDLGDEEKDYIVVVGYDANKNKQLEANEISYKNDWVCKIVPQEQYDNDIGFLNGWKAVLGGAPLTYDCVTAFIEESTPNEATSVDIEIARNEYGLSHAVGVLFQPVAEPGPSIKAVFNENSLMTEEIMNSSTFNNWLEEQFELKKGYVQQTLNNTTNEVVQFNWQLSALDIEFSKILDFDLAASLGHVNSKGKPIHVKVSVNVASGKTIEVKTTATLVDLYDFEYGGLLGYWVTPAARMQAGYNTLGKAGRVYKSEIQLADSLWPGEFDFD